MGLEKLSKHTHNAMKHGVKSFKIGYNLIYRKHISRISFKIESSTVVNARIHT